MNSSNTKITEATLARFAREVAKDPPEQAQSAVMACLSIVQQEQGWVSAESEAVIASGTLKARKSVSGSGRSTRNGRTMSRVTALAWGVEPASIRAQADRTSVAIAIALG